MSATGRMLAAGGVPAGAALGGLIADVASIHAAYPVMSGGVGLSAALDWLSSLRRADAATVSRLVDAAEERSNVIDART